MRFAVLISGSGTNLQTLIDKVSSKELNGEISTVFSNRKSAFGLERAKKAGIPTEYISRANFKSDEEYDLELLKILRNCETDFIVLAGYLRILTPVIINEYRNRIINIHPSLIPSFCGEGFYGMYVHEAAIKRGVKLSGATVHFVNEETDGGAIILQEAVSVEPFDTAESLQKKVLEAEHRLLPLAVGYFLDGKILIDGDKVSIRK